MPPVRTVYRAEGIDVSYHFLALLVEDASTNGMLEPVIGVTDSKGDEFNRGAGAMTGVGLAVSFRSECGPIDVELRFGAIPTAATPDKIWTGVVSFDQANLESVRFADPVFDDLLIPLPAGPGTYRTHVQWSYRPRLVPVDPDAPWDSWSEEDQRNPAGEDFWETVTITLESAPDAVVTAAPYAPSFVPEVDPADYDNFAGPFWTDQQGSMHSMQLYVEIGSDEWLDREADRMPMPEPFIKQEILDSLQLVNFLHTGVQFERPMRLPADPRQVADHIAPSIYVEVQPDGQITYGRRSALPPDDPRYAPIS